MKNIVFVLSLIIALVKAKNDCWSESMGYSCCEEGSTVFTIDKNGLWGQVDSKWCGIPDHRNYTIEIPDSCWSKKEGSPCCPEGTRVSFIDSYDREWGVMKDGDLKLRCGIQSSSKKEEQEKQEDTSLCWSMAKKYNDDGTVSFYPCCPEGTPVYATDEFGKWGITANNTSCGIRGGLNPWNDRSLVKSTKKEWEFFKTIWDNEDEKYDFERLSVFPGDNETVLNFGWYSSTKSTPVIRISSDEDMTDPVEFTGTVEKLKVYIEKYGMIDYILDGTQYYSNKVNVTGIKRNSLYYYQRKLNGKWEDPIEYKTYDPDNFSFIFMGDPQIGASRHRHTRSNNYTTVLTKEEGNQNDAFNWRRVISRAVKFARHPSLLLTAGDQVDESGDYTVSKDKAFKALKIQESQYSAYLYPDEMQKVPTANCVGNHEMLFENYRNHFNVPNPLLDFIGYGAWTSLGIPPEWTPGHSYFFKYNNALVVILETNYGSCVDFQTIIKRATKKYP